MPVPHKQSVEITANLRLAAANFEGSACDWSNGPNDAITALDTQGIAMSEQEAMAENIKAGIGLVRYEELNALVAREVPAQLVIDIPLVILEHSVLEV